MNNIPIQKKDRDARKKEIESLSEAVDELKKCKKLRYTKVKKKKA